MVNLHVLCVIEREVDGAAVVVVVGPILCVFVDELVVRAQLATKDLQNHAESRLVQVVDGLGKEKAHNAYDCPIDHGGCGKRGW